MQDVAAMCVSRVPEIQVSGVHTHVHWNAELSKRGSLGGEKKCVDDRGRGVHKTHGPRIAKSAAYSVWWSSLES